MKVFRVEKDDDDLVTSEINANCKKVKNAQANYDSNDLEFISGESKSREVKNTMWRAETNMTNQKYLNRRNIKFFEGTLSHLNTRELMIDAPRKRDKKASNKRI